MPGCGPYRSGRRGGVSPLDGMRRGETPKNRYCPARKKSRYFAQNQKTAKIMTGIFYGSTTGRPRLLPKTSQNNWAWHPPTYTTWRTHPPTKPTNTTCWSWAPRHGAAASCQDDWYSFLDALKAKDLTGQEGSHIRLRRQRFLSRYVLRRRGTDLRRVAGHGMHVRRFLRARGLRFDRLAHRARRQGSSAAIDESDPGKTDERVAAWCGQIKNE